MWNGPVEESRAGWGRKGGQVRRRSFAQERGHVCPPFEGGVVGSAIHASLKAWKGDGRVQRQEERRDAEMAR